MSKPGLVETDKTSNCSNTSSGKMTTLAQILSLTRGSREGWGSLCQWGRHVATVQSPSRDFFRQALYLGIHCLLVGLLPWMNCFLKLLEPKKIILSTTAQLHNRTPGGALKHPTLLSPVQFCIMPWLFGALQLAPPNQPIPWQMCCNGASPKQWRYKPPVASWPWELRGARCWPTSICRADTGRPPGSATPLSHGQTQVLRTEYKNKANQWWHFFRILTKLPKYAAQNFLSQRQWF